MTAVSELEIQIVALQPIVKGWLQEHYRRCDVDDIWQATVLKTLRARVLNDNTSISLSTRLITIAKSIAIDEYRSRRRRSRLMSRLAMCAATSAPPDETVVVRERDELVARLEAIVDDPIDVEMACRRWIEHDTFQCIGEDYGLNPVTVKRRIQRLRERARRQFAAWLK